MSRQTRTLDGNTCCESLRIQVTLPLIDTEAVSGRHDCGVEECRVAPLSSSLELCNNKLQRNRVDGVAFALIHHMMVLLCGKLYMCTVTAHR